MFLISRELLVAMSLQTYVDMVTALPLHDHEEAATVSLIRLTNMMVVKTVKQFCIVHIPICDLEFMQSTDPTSKTVYIITVYGQNALVYSFKGRQSKD